MKTEFCKKCESNCFPKFTSSKNVIMVRCRVCKSLLRKFKQTPTLAVIQLEAK